MVDNPRPEKVAVVDEVRTRLSEAPSVVITEYRGLSVAELAELRRSLRSVGGSYKVFKNTLARRAADELELDINELLIGPTALAFTETTPEGDPGDVVEVAKVIRDFAKDHENLVVKGGVLDGQPVDAAMMAKLADVESREVLLAKLAGGMAAPMVKFAGLLQAVPRNFAYALQALIAEGGAPGAPASEPTATDSDEGDSSDTEATDAPSDSEESGSVGEAVSEAVEAVGEAVAEVAEKAAEAVAEAVESVKEAVAGDDGSGDDTEPEAAAPEAADSDTAEAEAPAAEEPEAEAVADEPVAEEPDSSDAADDAADD